MKTSKPVIAVCLVLWLGMSSSHADEFSQQLVDAHNKWRRQVNVPALKWSGKLATFAQQWADHLKKAQSCKMQHRGSESNQITPGTPTGENLAWKWSSAAPKEGFLFTPEATVDAWASEIKFYDPATGQCNGGVCGHYTQLVWRDTTAVGCGRASCGNSEVWVCNYLPAGNYVGQKPY